MKVWSNFLVYYSSSLSLDTPNTLHNLGLKKYKTLSSNLFSVLNDHHHTFAQSMYHYD